MLESDGKIGHAVDVVGKWRFLFILSKERIGLQWLIADCF